MYFRFIGKDGSMGLKYNNIYELTSINSDDKYIYVRWNRKVKRGLTNRIENICCPYSSYESFAANWVRV